MLCTASCAISSTTGRVRSAKAVLKPIKAPTKPNTTSLRNELRFRAHCAARGMTHAPAAASGNELRAACANTFRGGWFALARRQPQRAFYRRVNDILAVLQFRLKPFLQIHSDDTCPAQQTPWLSAGRQRPEIARSSSRVVSSVHVPLKAMAESHDTIGQLRHGSSSDRA